jgi:putative phosphoesterase
MTSRIAIISDTHDNSAPVRRAVSMIKEMNPYAVLHCGDITSPATLELFAGLPLLAVFGNCDRDRNLLQEKAKELRMEPIEDERELQVKGATIYVCHGHHGHLIQEMALSGVYDYVFHGHTHVHDSDIIGTTRIVNPGALSKAERYTFATLDLPDGTLTIHRVDHEE